MVAYLSQFGVIQQAKIHPHQRKPHPCLPNHADITVDKDTFLTGLNVFEGHKNATEPRFNDKVE